MTVSTSDANSVGFRNPEYLAMEPAWELTDDLLGGTAAMKKASTRWLPKEEAEDWLPYNNRLSRSVLFNGYGKGLVNLSRRPFAKPVTLLGGPLPEPLDAVAGSVDDEGRNLTQFAYHVLRIAIHRGFCHILVDYPPQPAFSKRQERSERP